VSSLQSKHAFFRSIVDIGGSIELFCGIHMDTNWDEVFPFSLSAKLASLGIDLRLDAYPERRAQA